MMNDFLYSELTYKVRGAIFEVWKKLGPAFKESVFQKALKIEFTNRGIPFESQKQINIIYEEEKIGIYKPDFVINNQILLELKVLPRITMLEEKQIWYY